MGRRTRLQGGPSGHQAHHQAYPSAGRAFQDLPAEVRCALRARSAVAHPLLGSGKLAQWVELALGSQDSSGPCVGSCPSANGAAVAEVGEAWGGERSGSASPTGLRTPSPWPSPRASRPVDLPGLPPFPFHAEGAAPECFYIGDDADAGVQAHINLQLIGVQTDVVDAHAVHGSFDYHRDTAVAAGLARQEYGCG